MSDELHQVLIPYVALNAEGNEAFLSMSLDSMFPDNEGDEFFDDAYMEDIIEFETDFAMVFEDIAAEFFDDPGPPKMRPASKTAIEGLETVKIDERSGPVSSCSVCFEDISVGTEAKRLPCAHVYHTDCILHWLKESNTCPLCRYMLPVVDFDLNLPLHALDSDADSKMMVDN